MNKNAIQKYAIWARNELIEQIKQRAYQYGISAKGYGDENAAVVAGRVLSAEEKRQRAAFVSKIKRNGFEQAVEDVAYTWFNRFVALRFMEVNDYLPTHVRVFSDASGGFNPEILKDVLHLELEGLNKLKVSEMLNANQTEELYRYLLLTQCNALNAALPEMFEKLGSYTEMLLPNNILKPDSVLGRLVTDIPEEDWKDAVQIIGWMYQYYNTEPKQAVFDGLKKNLKITKEKIPAATQLFTPDWIVRYMVENSLGRLWLESHPNDALKANWKYYLDEAEQTPEVAEKLRVMRSQSPVKSPEDIRLIDPCMGSGHILVYAFDVLMQIYESEGYNPRDAAKLILEKNVYGLDIDRRAYQLAYFSLMMKARQYNRRIFTDGVKPQVYHPAGFPDGEEYGSLVKVDKLEPMPVLPKEQQMTLFEGNYDAKLNAWNFKRLLAQKYDVVVTNPPYMGSSGMGVKLSDFVKKNYPDSKSDLSTAFMEQTLYLCKQTGFMSMINIPVWMFLQSFEDLRTKVIKSNTIINMLHFGRGVFGSDFGSTSFVIHKTHITQYVGFYQRLFEKVGNVDSIDQKYKWFISGFGIYKTTSDNFEKIPGMPVAYWASPIVFDTFDKSDTIADADLYPIEGIKSGDNDTFLRFWHEVSATEISKLNDFLENHKWCFTTKGGAFRKWYGNIEYVIDWTGNGQKLRDFKGSSIYRTEYWNLPAVTWTYLTAGDISFRILGEGYLYNNKGPAIFGTDIAKLKYCVCMINSKVGRYLLGLLCSTLTFLPGDIKKLPLVVAKLDEVTKLADSNISLSRADWDAFETSWDFKIHPLVKLKEGTGYGTDMSKWNYTIKSAYENWVTSSKYSFTKLKANEVELNRIFINVYGLYDELTPEIEDKDITLKTNTAYRYKQKKKKSNEDEFEDQEEIVEAEEIRNAKFLHDTICEFISYAVGCMFGRYSLDVEGLAYAGGDWDAGKYSSFIPDKDNILPICDDEYFDDDIMGRFVDFIKTVYGTETLEENLKFIADALGGRGTPREVIRNYFLNDFYKDHCKTYKKRPIYWLFDSGKKNGFKSLIYLHRYQSDLLAKLRTDYVHEQQERYRTQLSHIATALNTATGADRARLLKKQDKLSEQLKEITAFEEKVHHLADQNIELDLDEGVKKNYETFADVLAKI